MPYPTLLCRSRSTLIGCAVMGLLCAVGVTPALLGQTNLPATAEDAWHFQFDLFQLLLEEQGLSEVVELDDALATPQTSVVVIVGPSAHDAVAALDKLSPFVHAGGTVLLAFDSPLTAPGIGRFMTGPVTAEDAKDRYGAFPDCVSVTDITNWGSRFNGVFKVITNRSTWFLPETRSPFQWEVVARFPRGCLPAASQRKPLIAIGRAATSGTAGDTDTGSASEADTGTGNDLTGRAGIIVVSADASLFTNGMLWYGDNAVLAIRTSALLCPPVKRRLAFIADGQALGSARQRIQPKPNDAAEAPPLPVPPRPELSQLLRLVNAVAKEVGDSEVLNETLRQRPRNVRPARYFKALMVLITVCVLAWAIWKLLISGSYRPILLRRRPMRSAYEMRALGGNDAGDYRQSAGYLAREFCWELTGSRSSADWQKWAAQLLTALPLGNCEQPSDLIRIIDIASRGCHERMSALDFQQLGRTISTLRAKQVRLDPRPTPT